ncbi:S9 family peptidase [Aestuariicella hydrocarbonica]|uniref:S9 family peptidase n=1 Tax=Pseudomaricurvus hydrocarbonicus TaxID=1470433 RepID=A0A9E5JP47_9GAMM|nr:prolyl oligopeptidase family serine peptidase [Aestuariicella hydrocarbonica]NHO63993.1 S9 family peptidase [Aestuariicella hydrocarbonica]
MSNRSSDTQTLPYGSWPSPITSDLLTRQNVRLSEPQISDSGSFWLESRPQEQGRNVLMFQAYEVSGNKTEAEEVLPQEVSVRSQAHEYGGASYLATGQGVFYVNAADQRVYHWSETESTPLTPEGPFRYADFCLDPHRKRLICVREDHRQAGQEEVNELVAIALSDTPAATNDQVTVLVSGHDFFSNPRLSPDGAHLSWLCWDHPCMPWDSSECWLSPLDSDGLPDNPMLIAGGNGESVFQPQWSPAGQLFLVSDRSNWWNLYRLDEEGLTAITQLEAEFATPQWVFGMSTYSFLSGHEILACFTHSGQWQLAYIDTYQYTCQPLATDFTDLSQIQSLNQRSVFLAANPNQASQLVHLSGTLVDSIQRLAQSSTTNLDKALISQPQAITFVTGHEANQDNQDNQDNRDNTHQNNAGGDSGSTVAHAFYYPPCNPAAIAPENTAPPLIVLCHGGPTGATETGLNLKIQYWTSRGFAVIDVNYRGSTGYGREYREQLNGAWGVHDVEDVCAAAHYLVSQGLANPEQIAIKGSSAGGYTVLAALTFSDTFNAGASLYGIGDLETLATDTHKFESRYLDTLVGAYPQQQALYRQRSPIHHAQQLNCPVIFFQGLDDKVVPPNQAEAMVRALDEKQVPVAYVPFSGEGHGFRRASSIERCLEAEWSFYGQVFGFQVPDSIQPVEVKNLPSDTTAGEQ